MSDDARALESAAPDHRAGAVHRDDLKEATLSGVRWVAGARVGLQVVGFASQIVLARLIGPAEYGRAAIAMIIVALSVPLGFQAFGSALVRFHDLQRGHLESAAFLSFITGTVLMVATLALAPVAIEPVLGHRVAFFMQIVSPVWLLSAISAVPLALLQRRMDFRRISTGEVVSSLAGTGATIGLALSGLRGEAIVIGALLMTAVSTAYYMRVTHFVPPRWTRRQGREVAGFGLPIALSSLAYIGFLNVDYALIGARLGPAQTGLYWRGYQLAYDYQGKVSGILQRIAFPLYSRTGDIGDMKRLRTRISRLHATVLFGPVLLLIPVAPALVPLLFGDKWQGAIRTTQLLVPVGLVGALTAGIGPVLTAAGKARPLLVINVINLILYATMVYFVAPHGLTVTCIAVSCYGVFTVAAFYMVMQRLVEIPMFGFLTDALPGLASGAVLVAAAYPVTRGLMAVGASNLVVVVAATAAGFAAYGLALRLFFPSTWADVRLLARRVFPKARNREQVVPPATDSLTAPR